MAGNLTENKRLKTGALRIWPDTEGIQLSIFTLHRRNSKNGGIFADIGACFKHVINERQA